MENSVQVLLDPSFCVRVYGVLYDFYYMYVKVPPDILRFRVPVVWVGFISCAKCLVFGIWYNFLVVLYCCLLFSGRTVVREGLHVSLPSTFSLSLSKSSTGGGGGCVYGRVGHEGILRRPGAIFSFSRQTMRSSIGKVVEYSSGSAFPEFRSSPRKETRHAIGSCGSGESRGNEPFPGPPVQSKARKVPRNFRMIPVTGRRMLTTGGGRG